MKIKNKLCKFAEFLILLVDISAQQLKVCYLLCNFCSIVATKIINYSGMPASVPIDSSGKQLLECNEYF